MAVAEPPLKSPLLTDLPNTLTAVWDRFFRDIFAASGTYNGTPHPTGMIVPKVGAVPHGWLLLEEKTIGDKGSGATALAHIATRDLFIAIWDDFDNTACPVSSGRGASGLADFKAGKTIYLPPMPGRVIGCSGSYTGLTTRATGALVGAETVTLTSTESGIASHGHTVTDPGHNHTQASHNHTQDSHNHTQDTHNHTQNSHLHTDAGHGHIQAAHTHGAGSYVVTHYNTGATVANVPANVNPYAAGGATTAITGTSGSTTATNNLGASDIQGTVATNQTTVATNQATTATNQATTATNVANTTGLTVVDHAGATAASAHTNMQPTFFMKHIIKL